MSNIRHKTKFFLDCKYFMCADLKWLNPCWSLETNSAELWQEICSRIYKKQKTEGNDSMIRNCSVLVLVSGVPLFHKVHVLVASSWTLVIGGFCGGYCRVLGAGECSLDLGPVSSSPGRLPVSLLIMYHISHLSLICVPLGVFTFDAIMRTHAEKPEVDINYSTQSEHC